MTGAGRNYAPMPQSLTSMLLMFPIASITELSTPLKKKKQRACVCRCHAPASDVIIVVTPTELSLGLPDMQALNGVFNMGLKCPDSNTRIGR
jgi:hypothetical protein